MTRLIAGLGVLCLIAFAVAWWPGAFLLAGGALLWLATVRTAYDRRGAQR